MNSSLNREKACHESYSEQSGGVVPTLANGLFLVFPHRNQSTGSILGTPAAQSIVRFNFNFPT